MVSTTDPIHLNKLDDNSLWSFFIKCAFGDDRYNVSIPFENIGRKIVQRLSGNPLATKTVGKLLKDKNDLKIWTDVLESEEWKYLEENDDIMPILRISYEKLPINLKQCFSYCSLFPKDYYFGADELVYLWMAQDFINMNDDRPKNFHERKYRRAEDVGIEYLNILVDRAFLQKVFVGRLKELKYVMHDLMDDLAQVVSSEEILVVNTPESTLYPPSLRHMCFLQDVKFIINENHIQVQNLSSLVILEDAKTSKEIVKWHQSNTSHLRMLIMPFMSSISYNFTHLRYLKLYFGRSDKEKATFPVQICKLYHLQVLELDSPSYFFSELPKDFNNLVNLRHFIAKDYLHSMIAGVGRLKHLQELKMFTVCEEKGSELCQLSELNKLRGSLKIHGLQNVKTREEAEWVRLSEKQIDNLEFCWYKETEDKRKQNGGGRGKLRMWLDNEGRECRTTVASSEEILEVLQPNNELRKLRIKNYGGCKSPSWLTANSIKFLESINILFCEAWEELPNFGQLMCLKELKFHHLPRVKALGPRFHGCSPHEGFPSLKVMIVSDMAELKTWVWSQGYRVFPSIEHLSVGGCPNLTEFTFLDLVLVHKERTECFSKLQTLNIAGCSQLQQATPQKRTPYVCTHGFTWVRIDVGFGSIEYDRSKNVWKIHGLKDPEVLLIFSTFKNICSMKFGYCPNLTSSTWKSICMIHSLKTLKLQSCHELCFPPTIEEENEDASTSYTHESLQDLWIDSCDVTGEELSYLLARVPAIRELTISGCNRIGDVYLPINIVEPNRASLKAGVKVDKDQQQSPGSLMCLEELHIYNCPNMVFVNKGGLSGLTALKDVTISNSDKLLYSLNEKEGSNSVHALTIQFTNITFLKLHSFVALSYLWLNCCKDLISVEGPNSLASLEVDITDCPKLAQTQSQIEPKFLMPTEKLKIDNMEFLSVHANRFSMCLHSLTIDGFCTLKYWSEWTEEQEIVVIKHLTALEELTLCSCKKLHSLPSTLHLHRSLKELTIYKCPAIKSLPQRGFPQSLQKLRLRDCSEELKVNVHN